MGKRRRLKRLHRAHGGLWVIYSSYFDTFIEPSVKPGHQNAACSSEVLAAMDGYAVSWWSMRQG